MGFLGFYVKIITKPKVLEGFRLAREKKKCPLYLIFCKGLLKVDDVRTKKCQFLLFFTRENGLQQKTGSGTN